MPHTAHIYRGCGRRDYEGRELNTAAFTVVGNMMNLVTVRKKTEETSSLYTCGGIYENMNSSGEMVFIRGSFKPENRS